MNWISLCIALVTFASVGTAACPAVREGESPLEWGAWWVVLPFDHSTGVQKIDRVYPPEKQLRRLRAGSPGPDFQAEFRGKGKGKVTWKRVRDSSAEAPDFGLLNFVALVPSEFKNSNPPAGNNAVAYAYRTITSPDERQQRVTFGSDDSCMIWLNGKVIHQLVVPRAVNPESDKLTLDLKAGVNHLLVKVSNAGGSWGAQMQLPKPPPDPRAQWASQDAINAAIDRGIVYMLQMQALDGSWSFEPKKYRNGQTALAVYALLKSGLTPEHPAMKRAFAYLDVHPPQRTYSLVCQILALLSTKRDRDKAEIYRLAAELEDWQDQAYGYPEGTSDLSNTQYGALGLWAAGKAGAKIDERAWARLVRYAVDCQNGDGGFGYRPGAGKSTGSMTVAGLTVIHASLLGLGDKSLPNNLVRRAEASSDRGLAWLAENFSVENNPDNGAGSSRWQHYYLYGVERMAALLNIEMIGAHNWYQEGAAEYVKKQGADGAWKTASKEGVLNTSFGLLFLNRATATLSGTRKTSRHQRMYGSDGEEAEVVLRAVGDTPLDIWISEVREATLAKHSREGAGGFGLYVESVQYLSDGAPIRTIPVDGTKPWTKQRFAFQHRFKKRGFHKLQVKFSLVPDPGVADATVVVLSSPVLEVRIDELPEDWMLDYPNDELANLVLSSRVSVRASSQRGGNDAKHAVDGSMVNAWACAKEDKNPTVTLSFKKSVRVDRIVLSHVTSQELHRGEFDRATKVEIQVTGKKGPFVYDLDPIEEHKTVLLLPKPMRIGEFSVRVIERLKGSKYPGCVGFAEIELRLGEE